ncbi:MAG TPA: TetR/AcrR family transcriptional regulator [Solirubrobacterales bacterium]
MKGGGDGKEGQARGDLGPLPAGHHGLSREQVAESQRERLLAAVANVVAEKGYRGATITEIVKAASVSSRVFYEFFESKDEAFIASFEAVLEHFEALIAEAIAGETEWQRQVAAALAAGLRFFDEEPELAKAFLVEPAAATPAIATRFREAVLKWVPFLEQGRAERPEGTALPASTEDTVLGGLVFLTSRSIITGVSPLPSILPDLVDFALSPYLGAEEAARLAGEAGGH